MKNLYKTYQYIKLIIFLKLYILKKYKKIISKKQKIQKNGFIKY